MSYISRTYICWRTIFVWHDDRTNQSYSLTYSFVCRSAPHQTAQSWRTTYKSRAARRHYFFTEPQHYFRLSARQHPTKTHTHTHISRDLFSDWRFCSNQRFGYMPGYTSHPQITPFTVSINRVGSAYRLRAIRYCKHTFTPYCRRTGWDMRRRIYVEFCREYVCQPSICLSIYQSVYIYGSFDSLFANSVRQETIYHAAETKLNRCLVG